MTGLAAKLLGAADDEGESGAQDLKVKLAEVKFQLQRQGVAQADQQKLMREAETAITEHSMTHVYQHFCDAMGWQVDAAAVDRMQAANEAQLKEFDEKAEHAAANDGDEEVRDALLRKADYLCNTGSRDAAWAAYAEAAKKSPSPASKLTVAFCKARREILYGNWAEVKAQLDAARDVCDKGGDWEKKNRLMVYEGVYSLAQRQFERAARHLLDAVATFTAAELFPYERCVFYAVVAATITLPRPELKKKVVDAPEVLTVLHKLPAAKALLHALFYCRYRDFFPAFLAVAEALEGDLLLAPHARYFMREARAAAYAQYLASYKAVTVAAMADAFGVGSAFLDGELAEFIVAGRLAASVDKVNGVVEAAGARARAAECNTLLKDGDHLLHRLQQLSKIVDVE